MSGRHAGGERQHHQQRHGGHRRHAGRQRHHRRHGQQRAARWRPATRSARSTVNGSLRPERPAAPTRSRSTPRARATASTSPARRARPPSTAARCRCWPQPGSYGRSTTYTILNATGGVSGTYSGVTSNFAFLTPSLSYDPNNVFLTLALGPNAFSASAATRPTSGRWARALDRQLRQRQRRLRHGAGRHGRTQRDAGSAGARCDQRPAIRRLRHDQHRQRLAVHERAGPADGAGARRQRAGAAPGAGAGLRGRGLRGSAAR